MQKQTKVYDYNANKVQDLLLRTLKQRGREATVTDLVSSASLPRVQVEEQLASISDEFGARLKVTESGEVLYSFPNGFKSRYTGFGASVKRFSKAALKFLEVAGTTLFKAWIMVMLVGYFALFVALLILALVASIAISMSSKSDERSERSGGLNGFALTGRLLELFFRIWFYSEVFKDPYQREYERNRNYERSKARGPKRPLHKAVFSFVFGETDPNAEFDAELRKSLISFVQAQKGIISMDEFSALCGLDELEAGRLINRYLLELEGSPEVSDAGTLYFSFPKLMLKADRAEASWPARLTQKKLNVFSANPKGMNFWFAAINAVNILFGSFFAVSALTIGNPVASESMGVLYFFYAFTHLLFSTYLGIGTIGIFMILGLIPLSFGVLFYAIPLLRMLKMQGENAKIKKENLARIVHRTILANPLNVELVKSAMSEAGDEASRTEAKKITERIAGETGADVSAGEGNNFHFVFTEIERRKRDIEKVRADIDLSRYNLGKTIFDSHETN